MDIINNNNGEEIYNLMDALPKFLKAADAMPSDKTIASNTVPISEASFGIGASQWVGYCGATMRDTFWKRGAVCRFAC